MFTTVLRSSSLLHSGRGALSRGTAVRPVSQSVFRFFSADPDETDEEDDTKSESVSASKVENPNKHLDDLPITYADISRAAIAIRGGVKRTTCHKSHFISEVVGANVYLKNEFRQFTGSFKERGARNAILQLMQEKGSSLRGVIAASAGNHAQALAYHGRELGVPATVVMPTAAPLAKVDKCRVSQVKQPLVFHFLDFFRKIISQIF